MIECINLGDYVMRKILMAASICVCFMLYEGAMADDTSSPEETASRHMAAEAMLTAHFIDAALKAGMSSEAINAVLADVAENSVISEFWISDEQGRIEFSNIHGTTFTFPTDVDGDTQAAPFAALLQGSKSVVVQKVQKRELDGALFKYVGAAGVDKPRIVQVGVSGEELSR